MLLPVSSSGPVLDKTLFQTSTLPTHQLLLLIGYLSLVLGVDRLLFNHGMLELTDPSAQPLDLSSAQLLVLRQEQHGTPLYPRVHLFLNIGGKSGACV